MKFMMNSKDYHLQLHAKQCSSSLRNVICLARNVLWPKNLFIILATKQVESQASKLVETVVVLLSGLLLVYYILLRGKCHWKKRQVNKEANLFSTSISLAGFCMISLLSEGGLQGTKLSWTMFPILKMNFFEKKRLSNS